MQKTNDRSASRGVRRAQSRRVYESVSCPCCPRTVRAYVPARGDGTDVKIVKHKTFDEDSRWIWCAASNRLKGELAACIAQFNNLTALTGRAEGMARTTDVVVHPLRDASAQARTALTVLHQSVARAAKTPPVTIEPGDVIMTFGGTLWRVLGPRLAIAETVNGLRQSDWTALQIGVDILDVYKQRIDLRRAPESS